MGPRIWPSPYWLWNIGQSFECLWGSVFSSEKKNEVNCAEPYKSKEKSSKNLLILHTYSVFKVDLCFLALSTSYSNQTLEILEHFVTHKIIGIVINKKFCRNYLQWSFSEPNLIKIYVFKYFIKYNLFKQLQESNRLTKKSKWS